MARRLEVVIRKKELLAKVVVIVEVEERMSAEVAEAPVAPAGIPPRCHRRRHRLLPRRRPAGVPGSFAPRCAAPAMSPYGDSAHMVVEYPSPNADETIDVVPVKLRKYLTTRLLD